jgi:predicted double-glycine peptidase
MGEVKARLPGSRSLLVAVVVVACLAVTDGQSQQASADRNHVEFNPADIHVAVPDVHQPNGYSCGAACMMAVLSYFGVGPEEYKDVQDHLGTTRKGTDFPRMVNYANRFKTRVTAEAKPGMSIDELKEHLRKGEPVICSIQAYSAARTSAGRLKEYETKERNGHYVVAIGCDKENIYFMDPILIGRRGFIPEDEFLKRWHDDEGVEGYKDPVRQLGIFFVKAGPGPVNPRARKID